MEAVALLTGAAGLAKPAGAGIAAAPAGVMEVVIGRGTWAVAGVTGAVSSFGCVTPAPGRALRVMRTVSFFNGTAAVFAGGVGG